MIIPVSGLLFWATLYIVPCPTYPGKFMRNVVATYVLL